MPRVIITQEAALGLERCRNFLTSKSPQASKRAGQTIQQFFTQLAIEPPLDDYPVLRELIIPFGDTGYVALYRLDTQLDAVLILAFRPQKEVGY